MSKEYKNKDLTVILTESEIRVSVRGQGTTLDDANEFAEWFLKNFKKEDGEGELKIKKEKNMSTRMKVRVNTVTEHRDADGNKTAETVWVGAVYSDDPDSENGKFFKATPNVSFQAVIDNPNAFGSLKPGVEYYLDFTECRYVEKSESYDGSAPQFAAKNKA